MNKEQKRAARCVCLKTLYANSSTGILFDEILDNFNDEEALEDINKDQIKYAAMLFDLTISPTNLLVSAENIEPLVLLKFFPSRLISALIVLSSFALSSGDFGPKRKRAISVNSSPVLGTEGFDFIFILGRGSR